LAQHGSQNGPHDGDSGNLQYDNAFWRFSLAVYGQDDVARECLALQETLGIDVNVLLFCAWLGARGISLSGADIEDTLGKVAAWHGSVVRPLRGVRQWIKTLKREEFASFRERVKRLELDAEQIEQAVLFAHSGSIRTAAGVDRAEAISHNVKQYLKTASAPLLIAAAQRNGA